MLEVNEPEGCDSKLGTYIGHIFAEQADRLFVNAVTLRGWELQVYRFDRSGVVCMQEKVNVHEVRMSLYPRCLILMPKSFRPQKTSYK